LVLESVLWLSGWGLRFSGDWRVVVYWGPWTPSCVLVRWLYPSTQPCWEFLPANPYLAHWVVWGLSFCGICVGTGFPLQCPHYSLLEPGFPLSPLGSREAGLNSMLCLLNQCFSALPNKSLNSHESNILPDSLEMRILTCSWLVCDCRGHFFLLLTS
jgi:hypothetical protein